MNINKKIKQYYNLTKPGIVYGNALMVVGGFFLGSRGVALDLQLLLFAVLGLSLIVASACVFNNYFDRDLDAKMERTKTRALAAGSIRNKSALWFGAVLLLLGGVALHHHTNMLTFAVALFGFVVYVFIYTPLKPRTPYALFVGAVAGAVPPVVGYTAAADVLDAWALFLFLFLFIWQLPHFLAIATYRYDEYAAAGVPLFIKKSPSMRARKLGRKVFFYSLVVLLLFCGALILQRWIM